MEHRAMSECIHLFLPLSLAHTEVVSEGFYLAALSLLKQTYLGRVNSVIHHGQ